MIKEILNTQSNVYNKNKKICIYMNIVDGSNCFIKMYEIEVYFLN